MMSITPEVIAEIERRHQGVEGMYAFSHQEARQAHADRATLLLALTEAQERAERAEGLLTFIREHHDSAPDSLGGILARAALKETPNV